ncbi:MAG: hypothetical protein CMP11_01560 [Zetaproteobacteria bacterium]|nr:hypothetical protein [Pseudobdellovibrionaceae bacterium]
MILVFFLCFFSSLSNLFADDLVDKNFLLQVLDQLKKKKNFDDNLQNLKEEQKKFWSQISPYSYDDLFKSNEGSENTVFPYNFLYQRGRFLTHEDESKSRLSRCYKVFVNKKNQMTKVSYGGMRTSTPRSYKKQPGWTFSYCVGEDVESDDESVLYFFHGAVGSIQNWVNRRALATLRHIWRKQSKLPKWVSISLGRLSLAADRGNEEKILETIIPYVENELGPLSSKPIKKRYGLGVSLGGANLTHLLLKKQNFFHSAALICPAISVVEHASSNKEIARYLERTKAYGLLIKTVLHLLPPSFKDKNYYRSVDPLILGQTLFGPQTASLYVQTSSRDEFGFQEGGKLLAMLARGRGVDVSYDELEGSHCVVDPKRIVSFFHKKPSSRM